MIQEPTHYILLVAFVCCFAGAFLFTSKRKQVKHRVLREEEILPPPPLTYSDKETGNAHKRKINLYVPISEFNAFNAYIDNQTGDLRKTGIVIQHETLTTLWLNYCTEKQRREEEI